MRSQQEAAERGRRSERRVRLAGMSTALPEAGDGPPILLLQRIAASTTLIWGRDDVTVPLNVAKAKALRAAPDSRS